MGSKGMTTSQRPRDCRGQIVTAVPICLVTFVVPPARNQPEKLRMQLKYSEISGFLHPSELAWRWCAYC